jgi:pimeloyl-ACP methyl ester carboxylesterase
VITGESRFWWSRDNVRLHLIDYGGADDDAPVVLCLPGLTRNHRDFDLFVGRYFPKLQGRARIWCADLRGRGESGWAKDPLTYTPLTYYQDMERLVEEFAPKKLILVGTSLGGILSMLMAVSLSPIILGSILNDVGPELNPSGLGRIRNYVGKVGPYPTWMHVAHALAETQKDAYPHFSMPDWIAMAKRLGRVEPNGRIVFDYDPKIAEPFKTPGGDGVVDLWPVFAALAQKPLLAVRGSESDVLDDAILQKMAAVADTVHIVTVPGVGHAPLLNEPTATVAMDLFFDRVLA